MKLARLQVNDRIIPVVADEEGNWRDIGDLVPDLTPEALRDGIVSRLQGMDLGQRQAVEGSPRPFLSRFGKIICIGLNYYDHAAEMSLPTPDHPIMFMKGCDVTGAQDPIIIHEGAEKTDWEVELGVVIGKTTRRVSEADALSHVAGFCIANDVSERHWQFDLGGQWAKGKSGDSFAPVGPFMATCDEIADPQNLSLWLEVNGERMQTGSTRTMIFSVAQIVAHLSRFVTLHPGDLIMTGTPPGVGTGQTPPKFLKVGDTVTASISGLGEMRQPVISYKDA